MKTIPQGFQRQFCVPTIVEIQHICCSKRRDSLIQHRRFQSRNHLCFAFLPQPFFYNRSEPLALFAMLIFRPQNGAVIHPARHTILTVGIDKIPKPNLRRKAKYFCLLLRFLWIWIPILSRLAHIKDSHRPIQPSIGDSVISFVDTPLDFLVAKITMQKLKARLLPLAVQMNQNLFSGGRLGQFIWDLNDPLQSVGLKCCGNRGICFRNRSFAHQNHRLSIFRRKFQKADRFGCIPVTNKNQDAIPFVPLFRQRIPGFERVFRKLPAVKLRQGFIRHHKADF